MMTPEWEQYAEEHTTPEPGILAKLNRETQTTQVYPRMLSGHLQGTMLRMISHMVKPLRVLEIGTFTGYSAICLASGLKESGVLHTIDVNPEQEDIIRRYFKEAGMNDRIILHIGKALDVMKTLDEQWDLVFIDADKDNYLNYYKFLFDRVNKGGYILADNAFWGGKVLDPTTTDKETLGIIEFNEFIQKDDRVENILCPIRDGLMIIRKK
jgi:caffeoyl-CoA O-methyltransferase